MAEPTPSPVGTAPGPAPGPPNRLVRNLVIGTLVAMVAANWLGAIFLSVLVRDHPLAFIGLNAQNRNLALASGELSAGSFYVVGFLRLLAPDPLFFLLGRWYGDGAIRWMERKAPAYGQILRQLEGWFEKARYVVVAFAPNNPVSLFAGASSMSFGAFMAANVVGTVARLWLIRAFSSAFEGPLGSLKDFIGEYRWPILVLSVVGVGISIWADQRNGRGAIGDLTHIEDEIDEIEASEAGEAGTTEPDATA